MEKFGKDSGFVVGSGHSSDELAFAICVSVNLVFFIIIHLKLNIIQLLNRETLMNLPYDIKKIRQELRRIK